MVKLSQGDTEYKAVVSFLLKVRMGVEENAATQMDRGHATEGSAGVNEHFKAQTLSSAKREPGKRGQNFLDPKIQYSEEGMQYLCWAYRGSKLTLYHRYPILTSPRRIPMEAQRHYPPLCLHLRMDIPRRRSPIRPLVAGRTRSVLDPRQARLWKINADEVHL